MPPVNLCCPKCMTAGRRVQLIQNDWRVTCTAGCEFEDTAELRSYGLLQPFQGKKEYTPPPMKPLEQATPLTLNLHTKVHEALSARFGVTLEQSFAAMAASLTDPKAYVVSGDDAKRLSELAKQEIKNGRALTGVLYALVEEVKQLNDRLKVAAVSAGGNGVKQQTSGDGVLVRLDTERILLLAEKAAFNQKSVEDYLTEGVLSCFDQGFI